MSVSSGTRSCFRPSPSACGRSFAGAWARAEARPCAAAHAHRRTWRRLDGIFLPALGEHVVVSDEHRWPSAEQLACVHPGDIRTDRARRVTLRGVWDVGAEQAAAAASPVVLRGTVKTGVARQI